MLMSAVAKLMVQKVIFFFGRREETTPVAKIPSVVEVTNGRSRTPDRTGESRSTTSYRSGIVKIAVK
jgi:hypothetical protein